MNTRINHYFESDEFKSRFGKKNTALAFEIMESVMEYEKRRTKGQRITTSKDVEDVLDVYYIGENVEKFCVVLLNSQNRVLSIKEINYGKTNACLVDVKTILKYVINENKCTGVILAHNHPSGNEKPSNNDLKWTKQINTVLEAMDVKLLDHVIYVQNNCYSMANNGEL